MYVQVVLLFMWCGFNDHICSKHRFLFQHYADEFHDCEVRGPHLDHLGICQSSGAWVPFEEASAVYKKVAISSFLQVLLVSYWNQSLLTIIICVYLHIYMYSIDAVLIRNVLGGLVYGLGSWLFSDNILWNNCILNMSIGNVLTCRICLNVKVPWLQLEVRTQPRQLHIQIEDLIQNDCDHWMSMGKRQD